jgi:hypothetical protein
MGGSPAVSINGFSRRSYRDYFSRPKKQATIRAMGYLLSGIPLDTPITWWIIPSVGKIISFAALATSDMRTQQKMQNRLRK